MPIPVLWLREIIPIPALVDAYPCPMVAGDDAHPCPMVAGVDAHPCPWGEGGLVAYMIAASKSLSSLLVPDKKLPLQSSAC
jgi:hypothetical protein